MARHSSYSALNVTAMVDGQKVVGAWDGDDAIAVEPLGDAGEMLVGAFGDSIFSQSANRGATITLRLQHTSPTHRLLRQRYALQMTPGVRNPGFPIVITDLDSGEGGACARAFIQTKPTDQKGNVAVVREWVLVTGEWIEDIPVAV